MQIMYVCTGNQCRPVMAEYHTRAKLADRGIGLQSGKYSRQKDRSAIAMPKLHTSIFNTADIAGSRFPFSLALAESALFEERNTQVRCSSIMQSCMHGFV